MTHPDPATRAITLAKSAASAATEAHAEARRALEIACGARDVAAGNRAAIHEVSEALGGIATSLSVIVDRLGDVAAAQAAILELLQHNLRQRATP